MPSALDDLYEWARSQIPPPSAREPASRMIAVSDREEPALAPPMPDRITPSSLAGTAQQMYQAAQLPPTSAQQPASRMQAVSDQEEPGVAPPPIARVTPSALGDMATQAAGAVQGAMPAPSATGPSSTPRVGYEDINPPEQPSPRPGLSAKDEYLQRTGAASASPATRAILEARETGAEPKVEGAPSVLSNVVAAVVDNSSRPPGDRKPAAAAVTTSSDKPTAAPAPAPAPKFDPKAPIKPKGAPGTPTSATRSRSREEYPDATAKASISPRFLVELEKSDPALHDGIIQAATAAGIGSWDYANLVYAASKGDPNYNEKGRVGLAGLTEADIARYQKERPELFRDRQGNPISAEDPHTNLIVGALKYRETRDMYGARTPSSIAAYYLDPGRVNELSRMTRQEQLRHLPAEAQTFVREGIDPDAKPGSAPQALRLTDAGTLTPTATAQAAIQASKSGNVGGFFSYMVNNVPRGMTPNDSWRAIENSMVSAFMRTGDVEGAQRAREMIFQMSHVGSNQALMSAYKMMELGDNEGAARQLAMGYFAAPDGGLAQFHVTPKGIIGQRYNEDTRKPTGAPFEVTKEKLLGMMNITRDPQAFMKTVRESQKTNAEIADKEADAHYKRNLLPSLERRADQSAETQTLHYRAVLAGKAAPGAGAGKVDPRVAHIDSQVEKFFGLQDLTGNKTEMTPALAQQIDLFKDMMLNNDRMGGGVSKDIAVDLTTRSKGGRFKVEAANDGGGLVVDRATNRPVAYLSPYAAQRFAPAAPPAPPPRIGATPPPAAGR